MNVLFDTSSIIALLVTDHQDHTKSLTSYKNLKSQGATFYISVHSIAELYRTLTWGKAYLNYSPDKAHSVIQKTVLTIFKRVSLSEDDYLHVLSRMVDLKLTGAIFYDGLISHAAAKIDAHYLVTFNAKDFQLVFPENGADLIIPG